MSNLETLLRNRAKQVVLDERRYERSLVTFIDALREAGKELGPGQINKVLNQAASTPEQKAAMGLIIEKIDRITAATPSSSEKGEGK